ncbi:DUF2793 domain-containing protein [Henriciella sp.]|uniref:DUF2793 domain-containing protein n=1 Tax=Henriciella sp. TaxID=1968823 RepID=UPI0026292011|nr:DUF2793 domain-containing protein [Henriciella sp.]
MDQSPRLAFPYLQPNQAQKHVTLNEALRRLDTLTGLAVASRQVSQEPAAPVDGDAYILPSGAAGDAWSVFAEGSIAAFQDGFWNEIAPPEGLTAWVGDETDLYVFTEGAWLAARPRTTDRLGFNTEAGAPNLLAVKSDAILFSHDDVTPGNGDIRLTLNRDGTGSVASVVFQTGYSGSAEVGLLGSGDLAFRTSPDGSSFTTGFEVRPSDGKVSFPAGFADPLGALAALGLRQPVGTIADDAVATLDFGGAVYGAAILAIPNATSSAPAAFFFARLAPSPSIETLFSAGADFTVGTETLTGASGEDGKVNFSVSSDGVLTIENRRGFPIGYTLYAFQR